MFRALVERFKQGHRTGKFPHEVPPLSDRFLGRPVLAPDRCATDCAACVPACPTQALSVGTPRVALDLGRCLFCGDCVAACPTGALTFSTDHRLATRSREHLTASGGEYVLAKALHEKSLAVFGRSLKLRQVSAAGCNACEADTNVLGTLFFDLGRFGIQFVASPRHADGVLVTGCVSENMRQALLDTYEAVPAPKLVIAVGACAISGGPYRDHAEQHNGVEGLLPVDLYVPGCPPHPLTILDGLLRLLNRMPKGG